MITHVAIQDRNRKVWSLLKPNRHPHVIHLIHDTVGEKEAHKLLSVHVQGFVNDKGEFMGRVEALEEAKRNNQLNDREILSELFSENLW